jgi:uncharacterized protein YbbC (DUF1343 family)
VEAPKGLSLQYVIDMYKAYQRQGKTQEFFSRASWFDQLMGTSSVRLQIMEGKDEATIRAGWEKVLEDYRNMRRKYLLY